MVKLFRVFLLPFSLLYGLVILCRNLLYDLGILGSRSFDISVISVGNLNVGGTGKSPHIEYLIKLLKDTYKIAILSRGYKRKTEGFISSTLSSTAEEIGDEPRQFKQKFPDVEVAVDTNRVRGITNLIEKEPELNVVLLDDAFQHRAVEAGLSILLTDYSHLYIDDFLLPYGNLRESKWAAKRADIVIVTRIPDHFSPMEKRIIKERLNIKPHQKLYFSKTNYGEFIPLNKKPDQKLIGKEFYFNRQYTVLLITGIAGPQPLLDFLKNKVSEIRHQKFRDHHQFTIKDILQIKQIFDNIASENKIILTTEKDAMRLSLPACQEVLKDLPVFYIPIEIAFHEKDSEEFNEQIISYVRKNQVNSRIYKKKY